VGEKKTKSDQQYGNSNVLLSFLWAENNNVGIDYVSIEKYPIDLSLAIETGYGMQKDSPILFNTLHEKPWNEKLQLSTNFSLTKIKQDFLDLEKSEAYDVLFYDAFAPSKQAEVWQTNYLECARSVLRQNGMLVTYCAQGQFKRTLKQVGFKVEVIKGPPGKREMIRAFKL
jgi:tRNA U34 5-methylaminomethyl-2-thiouridine-forming methyltransferase MnmC